MIQDINMFPDNNIHPILFEECYVKDEGHHFGAKYGMNNMIEEYPITKSAACEDYEGVHLFILVHGF